MKEGKEKESKKGKYIRKEGRKRDESSKRNSK